MSQTFKKHNKTDPAEIFHTKKALILWDNCVHNKGGARLVMPSFISHWFCVNVTPWACHCKLAKNSVAVAEE